MDKNIQSLPSVPLLNSKNYFSWSMKMKSVLTIKRLIDVITKEKPEDSKEAEEWEIKNADAVAYIQLSLSDEQGLQFSDENNAKQLWEKIKLTFTGKSEDRKIDASNEIKNLEMSEEENVSDYIARARGLKTKCAALGLEISERELVYHTVRGLRGKYSKIRDILKTQRDKDIDEILEILREEEKTLQKQNGSNPKKGEAFFTKNGTKNCSKLCFVCKKPNHLARSCFFRNNKNSNAAGFEDKRTFSNKNKQKNKTANYANKNDQQEHLKNFALISNQESECDFNSDDNVWILDSGCSAHMCRNVNFFNKLNPEKGYIHLAGKNSVLDSSGVGTVKAKTLVNNSENILTIENVIYVPDLRNNLISVSKLMDKGYNVSSNENHILILSENGDIVLKAVKVNNRFEIILNPCNDMLHDTLECNLVKNSNSFDLWHKRLCHLNPQYMSKMQNIIGINFSDCENFKCESCDISKVTRKYHPIINVDQSSSILELIHADLAGPININSLGNSKYFFVLVDDFSGMYFTYFLKHKNEVYDAFVSFKERYENLMNKKIKRLRTDNALEFISGELENFLDKSGIVHEKTIPYNPESNGKAERCVRVLVERARTLLYESELPLKFWAEAISCSTHISNLTPRRNKQKVPIEIWTGKKPNISYLKTFGCVAYYHIPKHLRNKFDVPAKRGIFVGYSKDRRGYRIYDISKNIVIEQRSVKFDETIKGSKFLINKSEPYLWNIENLIQFDECSENETENRKISQTENLDSTIFPPRENADDQNSLTSETQIVRRSERLKNKSLANLALNRKDILIPSTFQETTNSNDQENWKIAMDKEINSMVQHRVFEIIDRPKNEKIIKSKWVYSIKNINDDIIYKARLVAAAFNQIKNIDYSESYSPVVNIESFRLLIALAAKLNLNVRFFDVKTAYLYGDIKETVYLEIPPGYEKEFGVNKVWKLNRSIYGLPQSGRNWHIKLKSELKMIGLNQLASDNCVFTKFDDTNFLAICVYVDDLAIFSNNLKLCEEIIFKLRERFELIETTENSKFLGIDVKQDQNGISLSQTHYIESLINKYGMENCKKTNTPIIKGEDKCFNPTDDLVNQTQYQEIIGELLYLSNRTRPDLAFVTSYLSQFNKRPEKRHFNLAKRVLRYLSGSKDKVLFYDRKFGFLNCSADASWGNGEGGKSFSGCVVKLANSLIIWKSRKQRCVGLSTCEAELFAIAETAKDLTWIVNMLSELKCEQFIEKPIIIYSDSQAAIDYLKNNRSSNKTRHVNLKFYFIKDLIDEKTVQVLYISTDNMVSDFLTKAVPFEKLLFCLENICLI